MSQLDVRHDGRRILIPILILRAEPAADLTAVPVQALLDTGPTTSGIAARVAEALQLTPRGKRPLVSAQGLGYAERYAFRVGFSATAPSSRSYSTMSSASRWPAARRSRRCSEWMSCRDATFA